MTKKRRFTTATKILFMDRSVETGPICKDPTRARKSRSGSGFSANLSLVFTSVLGFRPGFSVKFWFFFSVNRQHWFPGYPKVMDSNPGKHFFFRHVKWDHCLVSHQSLLLYCKKKLCKNTTIASLHRYRRRAKKSGKGSNVLQFNSNKI